VSKQSNPKTLGLMAFVVLALGGGATYFQYNAVQAAKAEVAALEGQVPSQEELMKSLSDSGMKLADYRKKLEHLEKSVPDVAYIPTLMKELEQIGIGHKIKVTGVRPAPVQAAPDVKAEGKKQAKKDYSEVEIEVKGRGNYDDVKAFLDSLQTFPKVIAVKTVSLTPMRESGTRTVGDIEVVINVTAYVFPFEMLMPTTQPEAGSATGEGSPMLPPAGTEAAPAQGNATTATTTQAQRLSKSGGR
jgi:Tfp pilus assembly protein PilO